MMANYIRLSDKEYPCHPRCEMPWKTWPDEVPKATLDHFGYALVFPQPKPSDDAVEGQPILSDKGVWYQSWQPK